MREVRARTRALVRSLLLLDECLCGNNMCVEMRLCCCCCCDCCRASVYVTYALMLVYFMLMDGKVQPFSTFPNTYLAKVFKIICTMQLCACIVLYCIKHSIFRSSGVEISYILKATNSRRSDLTKRLNIPDSDSFNIPFLLPTVTPIALPTLADPRSVRLTHSRSRRQLTRLFLGI